MTEDLTDQQIELLSDVGEYHWSDLSVANRRAVERLIADGYVEATQHHPASSLQLTGKGIEFLARHMACARAAAQ